MARVPYLGPDQVAEPYRSLLARPANLFKALGNSPEGLRNFGRLGGFIRNDSTLDPRLPPDYLPYLEEFPLPD